ncbi:MAG TPA: 50S ribosomal protein L3 [Verrucomicrobiae bacterium]|nr:50S ribosomal protein L3 [Verrucomicrobiae bacterium]
MSVKALLARKVGMTQLFGDDGRVQAVTVLQAGPCPVVQVKTAARDGYDAIQLGFERVEPRRLTRARLGHVRTAGVEPVRHLREVRGPDSLALGSEIRVSVFSAGDVVDVSGRSKGKGFAGQHKRHNFGRGPVTHGSHNIRQPGSVGSVDAARTLRGLKMAGHLGDARVTVRRLHVVSVDEERNLLLVRGAVPGTRTGLVLVRASAARIRKPRGHH